MMSAMGPWSCDKVPHFCHNRISGIKAWLHFRFQLSANAGPRRQQGMTQVTASRMGDVDWVFSFGLAHTICWKHLRYKAAAEGISLWLCYILHICTYIFLKQYINRKGYMANILHISFRPDLVGVIKMHKINNVYWHLLIFRI